MKSRLLIIVLGVALGLAAKWIVTFRVIDVQPRKPGDSSSPTSEISADPRFQLPAPAQE